MTGLTFHEGLAYPDEMPRPKYRSASSWAGGGASTPRKDRNVRPLEVTLPDETHWRIRLLKRARYGMGDRKLSDGTPAPGTSSAVIAKAVDEAFERMPTAVRREAEAEEAAEVEAAKKEQ